VENCRFSNFEVNSMKWVKQFVAQGKLVGLVMVIAIAVIGVGLFLLQLLSPSPRSQTTPTSIAPPLSTALTPAPQGKTTAKAVLTPCPVSLSVTGRQTCLGHFPYAEVDRDRLNLIGSYGEGEYQRYEFLEREAAQALMKLMFAARNQGVWIIPVSGFRSIEQQQQLFQEQIAKQGSPEAAAKISAPAGYSEHHTGYAVDLTDGKLPDQDITCEFETTAAFQWLKRHASEFGFELSFFPNNPQGVSYEPWHWRFISSSPAAKTFALARQTPE
jgi:D-alanyl-D-alanine carboxypeptidase